MAWKLLQALTTYQTWDEYIWKKNLVYLLISMAVSRFLNGIHWDQWVPYLCYAGAYVFHSILNLYLLFTIATHMNVSYINKIMALPNHGPVTKMLISFWQILLSTFRTKNKTTTPAPANTPMPTPTASQPPTTVVKEGLFSHASRSVPVAAPAQSTAAGLAFLDLGSSAAKQPSATEPLTLKSRSKSSLSRVMQQSERRSQEFSQPSSSPAKLSMQPSVPPHRTTTKRMDKSLWQLRTGKMEEDFRSEQIQLISANWAKFSDRSSSVFFDRLHSWLSKNVLQPLAASQKKLDDYSLALFQMKVVECSYHQFSLLSLQVDQSALPFSVYQVYDSLCYPGLDESVEVRAHMAARIQDLAIGNKLAAYRYSTQDRHFPSDAKILWYVFKTYLEYEKPNTVPPLTGDDNDIFKFLLIYFYITDDLQREIFD